MKFKTKDLYTRQRVYQLVNGDDSLALPTGGNWATGYVAVGDELFAFINLGVAGRTGHDWPNHYDDVTKELTWFGKTNTHSAQPVIKKLLQGQIKFHAFGRWNNKNTRFTYLGVGKVLSFTDDVDVEGSRAIKIFFQLRDEVADSDTGTAINESPTEYSSGYVKILVNRYERDPYLREQCLEANGFQCAICAFDFVRMYGDLGRDYCHVHHIHPLGEGGSELNIDPIKDLIPICPNCHAMLHRKTPALTPEQLKEIIDQQRASS